MHIVNILSEVRAEFERANCKHPPMNSHHEAYAVILEEVEEYWQEVMLNPKKGCLTPADIETSVTARNARLKAELIQMAAMCFRTLHDLC